jgi:hypothetical protein
MAQTIHTAYLNIKLFGLLHHFQLFSKVKILHDKPQKLRAYLCFGSLYQIFFMLWVVFNRFIQYFQKLWIRVVIRGSVKLFSFCEEILS